ncbi:MAG: cell division protein FtsL [Pseudomonadota bacterium]
MSTLPGARSAKQVQDKSAPGLRFWIGFAALLIAVCSSALGVIYTTFTSRHLLNALQQQEKQRNDLQVEWGQLLLEQSSIVAQGKVEELAVAELDMEVPDMNKVVVFKGD